MSGRPLDVLEATLGDRVTVRLKDGAAYAGELGGYDQHMNVVLDPAEEDPANDAATETVESTTIIRGDNVVSITP
ncbi:LSM domain-containing protein [Halococcus hamelinensis]|jgi:small nuclear ribonucleoprotein|uniref:Sm ribonucleoprotein-like protein n=1 Tax=Halococcus hamelinensis 100A6 TaxID=1132509 RepID=M0M718_9EURY|nr:LSM domain-containing protein [Halococcus hamelinensis]EMA41602.1 Sm ribonucleoprotein-like protein [Halococcus hamelinensis 100A6]